MSLLLIIILAIALMAAVILLMPFNISFEILKDGSLMTGFYRIRWLGLTLNQNEFLGDEPAAEAEPEEPGEKGRGRALSREDMLLLKDSLPSIASTVYDMIRCISMRSLDCRVTLGMSDPAETATLSGYIWSASSVLLGPMGRSIRLEPYFGGERLDGSIMAEFQFRLLCLAAASIRALRREPLRNLIENLIRENLGAKAQG